MSEDLPEETDLDQLTGFTLVEVHMRLFLDADGEIDHQTIVDEPEGNLPPLYAVLGAWELAKDTIKEQYEWFQDECDGPDCDCCYEEDEDEED